MVLNVIENPLPPATVQVTALFEITQVNGPDRTFVPGARLGVPRPGFDPHRVPTHVFTTPDEDKVT